MNIFSHFSQYTFNDLSGSVSLAWVGDGTGVSITPNIFHWHMSRKTFSFHRFLSEPVEPSHFAGHPGPDNFSGALLHDTTRAVQTLSKVSPMTSLV